MMDALRRLTTFGIASCFVAYVIFIVAGAAIRAQAVEQSRVVWVRDVISPNRHMMSGIVVVDSTCTELIVQPQQVSEIAYELHFTTWEYPNIECEHTPTPRAFHTAVFAPAAGVEFIATLDNRPLPIIIAPDATSTKAREYVKNIHNEG